MIPSPRLLNLPHDEWREHQYETHQWLLAHGRKRISIIGAPTGSGKSMTGAALGGNNNRRARIITHTKALQMQYSDGYDCEELFGMGAYPCTLFEEAGLGIETFENLTADACTYVGKTFNCPAIKDCEYHQRKAIVQASHRQSLNYSYFLTARWPKENKADFLYLDECHNIPSILMDAYTLSISQHEAQNVLGIPAWPAQLETDMRKWTIGKNAAITWLSKCQEIIGKQIRRIGRNPPQPGAAMRRALLVKWRDKMALVLKGLTDKDPYYIALLKPTIDDPKKDWGNVLRIVPLTAKKYFEPAFMQGAYNRIVMTSATVGNHTVFGNILGLSDSDYDFRGVPHRFAPDSMPVYVPKGTPRISAKSSEKTMDKQGQIIKDLILSLGKNATGLVHFASKRATFDMATRLARIGLGDRIYTTSLDGGTEARAMAWKKHQRKTPNAIHLSWCFWEGYDGYEDNFSIVAKAPYPQLNEVVRARIMYDDGEFFNWRTAIKIEQGVGRVRRGDPAHYGANANKLTAIVDGNALRLTDYFSEHFNQTIQVL